jgi:hypothetical protein
VADSRDMSWLWDVDFSPLKSILKGQSSYPWSTGIRAADMALRLSYDEITTEVIEQDMDKALARFAKLPGDKVIFATYTAMLRLHTLLERKAGKEL